MNIIEKLKKEWFLLLLLAMIALAMAFPQLGKSSGILELNIFSKFGVTLIFFLYGVKISPQLLIKNFFHWRLHLAIQSTTFLLYPLIWLLANQVFTLYMPLALALGFCYLLVLPSTVSSSVAMTSAAQGNVAGAIFNASLSNVVGILITPMLVRWFMGASEHSMPLFDVIVDIMTWLLLPLVLGQLSRPWLATWCQKNAHLIAPIDKFIILLIVLNVFSDSVAQGIWNEFSLFDLFSSLITCLVILLFVSTLIKKLAPKLGFNRQDEIAIVFCGTKKTLVAGVPMAKIIFDNDPRLGMILLPIMIYHPLQIFYCAILANKYQSKYK